MAASDKGPLDNFGRDVSILDDLIIAFGMAGQRISEALVKARQEDGASRVRLEAQQLRLEKAWSTLQAGHTMNVTYMDDAEHEAYIKSCASSSTRLCHQAAKGLQE